MEQLLAILLYLAVITSPNTYYESEIYRFETDNQTDVDAVENDPQLLPQVMHDFGDDAQNVIVIDDWTGN